MIDDETLRTELLRRRALDGEARAAIMADYHAADEQMWERVHAVDRDNTAWLREIVATTGWPGRSRVGVDAADAAWLLVQHADHDPAFQRHCLDLMQTLPEGEIEAAKLALLTDRVLLAEGRPQRYGTQAALVDGRYEVRETEDLARVDERRAAVGLEPLAEHLARFTAPEEQPSVGVDRLRKLVL